MLTTLKIAFPLAVLTMLGACQKHPNDVAEAKSYQYYMEHAEETKAVAEKCSDLEKNELSTLSPDKRAAWQQTASGINCGNAQRARTMLVLTEFQRERSDAAKKLGK